MAELLNTYDRIRFKDIVIKKDKTVDEDFLVELIHHICWPAQIEYLYNPSSSRLDHAKTCRSTSVRRGQ
jgi:hypothetical protein